jgi:hypothetical protein
LRTKNAKEGKVPLHRLKQLICLCSPNDIVFVKPADLMRPPITVGSPARQATHFPAARFIRQTSKIESSTGKIILWRGAVQKALAHFAKTAVFSPHHLA